MSTTIHDLPEALLTTIITLLTDTRTRNTASLVNHKWSTLERQTRAHLSLRGNIRDLLYNLPTSFANITNLDLSHLSPWGVSLSSAAVTNFEDPAFLLCHRLRHAFPLVRSLTAYARSPSCVAILSIAFPNLVSVKLVRWQPRPAVAAGSDLISLLKNCCHLESVDVSCFYCWTEDIPAAVESCSHSCRRLVRLNLLNFALSEGFKSDQILTISRNCVNLRDFRVGCMFDTRYLGFIGDEALLGVSSNCKHLRVLHLVDISTVEREFDEEGFSSEDSGFTIQGLIGFFSRLMEIEELVLDVGKNVRGSWVALEELSKKCVKLRVLELGCFHEICKAVESHLDGVALCQRLESLSIKNSADLSDSRLIEIGRGCCMLRKFEVSECRNVTMRGLRTMVCLLKKTLVEVNVSSCRHLRASSSLKAVEPISERITKLKIDCIWDDNEAENGKESELLNFDLENGEMEENRTSKRCRLSLEGECSYTNGNKNEFNLRTWERLEFLSLCIGVEHPLDPLANAGLENCPNLKEIHIKVHGDCRERPNPGEGSFGIDSLSRYQKLTKMKLDCGETIGYSMTAPLGHMDLSMWERWWLKGLSNLSLNELDYWPPQDKEVNQRSLSLPAVGLISKCYSLRKLFIHGTVNEHFMMMFTEIPNLRDGQLRGDYYPAPDNDMSTEMRDDSCCRFEIRLNSRQIPD